MERKWIYERNEDNSSRYVLGIEGKRTVFCMGINPSTAEPDKLDPTLRLVETIALNNGYDSWIMFNVYPKRATDFKELDKVWYEREHQKNVEWITKILKPFDQVDIWLAFGNHIYDRDYLICCLIDIYNSLPDNINWLVTSVNKSGAPKHPLYQKKTSKFLPFDMNQYILNLK